jgi:hypothetical protein
MVKSQVLFLNPFATMNKIFSMELQRGKKILDPFMHDPKVNKGIDVCDLQNKKNKYFEYYIHKNSVRYKNHSSINIVLSIEKKVC